MPHNHPQRDPTCPRCAAATLGRLGGQQRSERKAAAARINGRKPKRKRAKTLNK